MASEQFSERIIEFVSDHKFRPLEVRELADRLGVSSAQLDDFRDAAEALHRDGRVILGEDETIMPPEMRGKIIGIYRANPRGFGFVVPETVTAHGDLFIAPGHQKDAITGDTVLTRVLRKGKRGSKMVYEGRIVRVLDRGQSQFVGRLQKKGRHWLIVPEGRTWNGSILIPDATSKNAKKDTQVVVQITQYPTATTEASGVIVEVLGRQGDPGIDTITIIRQHNLPTEFSKDCLQQAQAAALDFDVDRAGDGRLDLRHETIITIDPEDAKDYDDAISLKFEDQAWELGVHIADVAHFVPPGSHIDTEAKQRGNSVYFPKYVIPMLPETLSNGACSLAEGVPRFTQSVFIRYDDAGKALGWRFARSIISSRKRLTYQQAALILEGKAGGFEPEVVELLRRMDELARIIQRRRLDNGMLTLDLPSKELVLDDDGRLIDVVPEDRSFPHTIIEMFMVEANDAAAELLTRLKVPHLRRVHPEPDSQAGSNVTDFLNARGYSLPKSPDRQAIQKVLEEVKGKPESFTVNLAILRSMQQAEYAPELIGHYALASEAYSHFTSPIRRYPDLTIHRLITQHLSGELKTKTQRASVPTRQQLTELGTHCSFTERRAEDAERELRLIKVLQHLTDRVGDSFGGVVSGVARFGVFVQLDKYGIDGLVRREDLPDDRWELLPNFGCLAGEHTGRRITIGDAVEVTILRVDLPARRMDLHFDRQITRAGPGRKKPARTKKRGAAKPRARGGPPAKRKKRRR